MSVDFNTTINGALYSYNPGAIRDELAGQGVAPGEIEKVLQDISGGGAGAIRKYGLEDMLVSSGGAGLPPATLNPGLLASTLERDNVFNMLEVMYLLHESSIELREANREMRHADRDMAMAESYRAADKIRAAALTNLVMGVVQGAISIGMGAVSLGMSIKQGVSMKGAAVESKSATLEMNQVKADQTLSQSQVELKQTRADIQATEQKIQTLETRQSDLAKQQVDLDADVKAKQTTVDKLQTELDTAVADKKSTPDQIKVKQEALDNAKTELSTAQKAASANQAEIDQATQDMNAAKETLATQKQGAADLEGRIKGEAADADAANKAHVKSLKKSVEAGKSESAKLGDDIDAKQSEIKQLEGQTPPDTAKIDTAKQELAALGDRKTIVDGKIAGDQVKLAACEKNVSMYLDPTSDGALNGARARLDAASGQLGSPVAPGPVTTRYQNAQAALNKHLTAMQTTNTRMQSASMGVGGVNQALKGIGDYVAAEDQAEGAEHTANAQKFSSSEQENADFQKSLNDLAAEVRNTLKMALQSQNQANSSIYRNM